MQVVHTLPFAQMTEERSEKVQFVEILETIGRKIKIL